MSKVGIFGAGWVGLVTGACFAELGHEVVIRDVVPEKVQSLRAGSVPFHEEDVPQLLAKNAERLTYTLDVNDVADCEFLFVCVDTPPTYSGDADLSRVWTVIDELPELQGRPILVMKSTVPVGTGEKIRAGLDQRGLDHVGYVSNPEFLAEGRAVRDFMNPDRIVVGAFDAEDGDAVARLYEAIDAPIVRTDVNSAEMIKLAANAFLMTRISFINEIANVCEATGADVVKVAEGVGLDKRLGPHFLRAGIGYGGSCFPKDSLALKQLASNSGYHFQLLSAVIEVNELQKRRVIGKLKRHLGPLRGKTIALLGLAFKANTDDMREAPSIVLASRLLAEGADVRAWDPVADGTKLPKGVEIVASVADAVRGADAAVIVTEWDELRGLASDATRSSMANPLIVDGRNLLDPEETRNAGFVYDGIGRPPSPSDVIPQTAAPAPARRAEAPMEAIILAGGKAERLGDAAGGRPKALVEVAGRPLAAYQVGRLVNAGVRRVIFACAAGQGSLFESELAGLGAEIVAVEEPERLGRGGGIKFAAQQRGEDGDVYALNGDELVDVDYEGLLATHRGTGAQATITVAQPKSQFGLVDVDDDDRVHGFREGGQVSFWVNCGNYVLSAETIERFPDKGDHESTTFPELAAEGALRAFRHRGLWLTVNTPKELRVAQDHVESHPEWLA